MSSAARPRIGRSYTKARRHPWVLGKIGDWRIPMGPYTPPQLVVAAVGAFLLIKTAGWWMPVVGPLPVVAWAVAIWAARHSRIAGRSPFLVAADALSLALSPRAGQINGRAARPPRPVVLARASFTYESAGPTADPLPEPARDIEVEASVRTLSFFEPRKPEASPVPVRRPEAAAPVLTPLQQMIAAASAAGPVQKGDPR
ncbi:hypothetical protein [Kitasatospora griseola]|uniref:hypothetical protein n=1 Tax=Kitasatospora griseola TaxID=2064 RepID=UPI00342C350D